jgi:hypothetical protein
MLSYQLLKSKLHSLLKLQTLLKHEWLVNFFLFVLLSHHFTVDDSGVNLGSMVLPIFGRFITCVVGEVLVVFVVLKSTQKNYVNINEA